MLFLGACRVNAQSPKGPAIKTISKEQTVKKSGWLSKIRGWFRDAGYSAGTDKGEGCFTKTELKERLKALAASTPPPKEELATGAMCYKPVMLTGTVDVLCTTCQSKNIVAKSFFSKELDEMTRYVQLINKSKRNLDVTLDNRFMCTKCNPKLKDHEGPIDASEAERRLYSTDDKAMDGCYLLIKMKGEEMPRRVKIDLRGLKLLAAFVQGKDRVTSDNDRESPLKDQITVIQQILGLMRLE